MSTIILKHSRYTELNLHARIMNIPKIELSILLQARKHSVGVLTTFHTIQNFNYIQIMSLETYSGRLKNYQLKHEIATVQ